MSSFESIANILPSRSHRERIEIAVQDLLMADPFIADPAWCGQHEAVPNEEPFWPDEDTPRIYRVPDARIHPTARRPFITIGPVLGFLPWALSGEADISHDVLIVAHVDETRDRLLPGQKSYVSVLHHIWEVLTTSDAARGLQVARYGHRALVQPSPEGGQLLYAEWITGTLPDGTHLVERQPALQVTYKYLADRKTGQPAEFMPDE